MKLNKKLYYFLNATSGILMTGVGLVATIVLISLGYRPKKHKLTWYFVINGAWGGITLGMCVIVCEDNERLLNHEFGHTIQNAIFGVFMPFIGLASLARATIRTIQQKNGKQLKPYDSVWFEKQATEWGRNYPDTK